jgi:predicted NBD/HSP70 family sugar kinase
MPSVTITTSGVLQKSALREANDRLVLDTIRRNPGISRNQLAQISAFSPTSMSFVVNRLLRSGLVREEKLKAASSGRPPTGLWLCADALTAIGVEIAKPVSRVILVDLQGEILMTRSLSWESDPKRFLSTLAVEIQAVGTALQARQVISVGVSLPGTIHMETGRVIGAEGLGWFDVEAGAILRELVDWPLLFENNANLAALAEQWYSPGLGLQLRYFIYILMQGGLGSAVVVDNRILHGYSSSGTEFGHSTLYPDGHRCACGNRGCWELYASDAALVRHYRERGGVTDDNAAVLDLSYHIIELARAGDATALAALHETAGYLGLGLASMTAALNPQAIVVGAPMAAAWDLVEDRIRAVLAERVSSYYYNGLQVMPSSVDTDSALRGAAILALRSYFNHFDHAKADTSPNRVVMEAHGSS